MQAIKALAPRLRAARTLRGPPRLVAASVTATLETLVFLLRLRITPAAGVILRVHVKIQIMFGTDAE